MKKTCDYCGKEFKTSKKKQRFCGIPCSSKGRRSSGRRKLKDKECDHCGLTFRPRKAAQRFCGRECSDQGKPRRTSSPKCPNCGHERYRMPSGQWRCAPCDTKARKKWYAENKEKAKADALRWARENRERRIEIQKDYRRRNPKAQSKASRKYKRNNRAKVLKAKKEYYRKNKHQWHDQKARRRTREARGRLSKGIEKTLMKRQKGLCVACRADLKEVGHHLDHIIPLAKGGLNIDSNVRLLCPPCNLSKHARDPIEFMQEKGWLL